MNWADVPEYVGYLTILVGPFAAMAQRIRKAREAERRRQELERMKQRVFEQGVRDGFDRAVKRFTQ
jgi:hypothetical protein